MSNMKLSIKEKEYNYTLNRKNVKKINISIKYNKEIVVSSSEETPIEYIENLLIKKSSWIDKKISFFEKNKTNNKKKYVSGEDFLYLGKHYRLKVEKGISDVHLIKNNIIINVEEKADYELKDQLIDLWYKENAKVVLNKLFMKTCDTSKKYDLFTPTLIIRSMKSRWGTYNIQKNRMTLNLELIKAPKDCIEYVIVHELVHQKYKNHNKDFYDLLSMIVPDWERRKKMLDEEIQKYL